MRQPKTHVLKCWTQYFQEVKSGAKPFEIRLNDRDYQTGDTLVLKEFIPQGEKIGGGQFTGDKIVRTVSYMTDWEQKPGYVVLGIPNPSGKREVLNQERYEKARKLLDGWSVWFDDRQLVISVIDRAIHLEREIERLSDQSEATKLREALDFYADPATYDIGHLDKHGYIIIDRDGGQKAREALSSSYREVKYAIKLGGEYMRERYGSDCFTDDLGQAILFDCRREAEDELIENEHIVEISVDEEGGLKEK